MRMHGDDSSQISSSRVQGETAIDKPVKAESGACCEGAMQVRQREGVMQ